MGVGRRKEPVVQQLTVSFGSLTRLICFGCIGTKPRRNQMTHKSRDIASNLHAYVLALNSALTDSGLPAWSGRSPVAIMANKHQPSLEGIPLEIKRVIALHLPAADNKNLVCVSSSFREAVEPINWSAIRIKPHHIDFDRLRDWENASLDEQQSAVHAIEDAWRRCAELLRRDPRRQTWLKAVRGVVIDSAADSIRDVLELVKDSVVEISQETCPVRSVYGLYDADSPTLARAINAVRILPYLTRLSLYLCENWETDAINAVRSTPRLEEFTARAGSLTHDDVRIFVSPIPRLPRLRKLHIDTKRWYAGTRVLLAAAASQLESLTLWISWAWSPFQIGGIPDLFALSPNLRILDLRGNNLAHALEYASNQNDLSEHWPRLEALTIHAPVRGSARAKNTAS